MRLALCQLFCMWRKPVSVSASYAGEDSSAWLQGNIFYSKSLKVQCNCCRLSAACPDVSNRCAATVPIGLKIFPGVKTTAPGCTGTCACCNPVPVPFVDQVTHSGRTREHPAIHVSLLSISSLPQGDTDHLRPLAGSASARHRMLMHAMPDVFSHR